MQNLIALLKRYRNLLLFLLLQGVSLGLLVSNNNFHKATFLNSTKALTSWVDNTTAGVTQYFGLRIANEQVFRQSALLKEQLFNNDSLSEKVWIEFIDTTAKIKFDYIAANVINNTTKFQKNYLDLDVGTSDNIDKNKIHGVVGPDGIIGFTRKGRATSNYISVVSILNTSQGMEIDVMHEKSGNAGQLVWGADDDRQTASVLAIPSYVEMNIGDKIVTNGLGGLFPKGEQVGFVTSIEKEAGTNNYMVKIRLATNFNALHYAHVIRNIDTYELDSLKPESQKIKQIPVNL